MTTRTWTDVDTQDLEGTNAFRLMPTDALVDRPATGASSCRQQVASACAFSTTGSIPTAVHRTASCSPDVMVLRMT